MCGKVPSSQPVTKTTGNSRPFAVCRVIRVTTPVSTGPPSDAAASASGIWSESATRETRSRKSARSPSGSACSNSEATACSSARLSTREPSCGSSLARSSVRYPVRSSTAPSTSAGPAVSASSRSSVIICAKTRNPTSPRVPSPGTRGLVGLRVFAQMMTELRELAETAGPAEVLGAVLDRTGYLTELRASDDPQDGSRVDNLAELHAVASEFEQAEPDGDLADFLERVSLVADSDQIPDADAAASEGGPADTGQVTLMTLHTAKGLEFPVVFVTGWEDGTFPHMRSLADPDQLAEERRLAYVGLTRAQKRLYISRAAVRTAWGVPNEFPASRFLDDVPEELVDWRRRESSMAVLRAAGSGWGGGASAWGRPTERSSTPGAGG